MTAATDREIKRHECAYCKGTGIDDYEDECYVCAGVGSHPYYIGDWFEAIAHLGTDYFGVVVGGNLYVGDFDERGDYTKVWDNDALEFVRADDDGVFWACGNEYMIFTNMASEANFAAAIIG